MKVFLTVGSMLPFDRLVLAMDRWACDHSETEVFGQIGHSSILPRHFKVCAMLDPEQYREQMKQSDLIVSHVGMGTVISAVELGKPLVMMPRRPELSEVTSDHQVATTKWLAGRPGVTIANTEADLPSAIATSMADSGPPSIESGTRGRLILALRTFIGAS